MRINEVATKVRVQDKGRPYFYYVTVAKPEKAKAAAASKHRKAMGGVIPDSDLDISISNRSLDAAETSD